MSGRRVGTRAAMNAWLCAHRTGSMPAGGGGSAMLGRAGIGVGRDCGVECARGVVRCGGVWWASMGGADARAEVVVWSDESGPGPAGSSGKRGMSVGLVSVRSCSSSSDSCSLN